MFLSLKLDRNVLKVCENRNKKESEASSIELRVDCIFTPLDQPDCSSDPEVTPLSGSGSVLYCWLFVVARCLTTHIHKVVCLNKHKWPCTHTLFTGGEIPVAPLELIKVQACAHRVDFEQNLQGARSLFFKPTLSFFSPAVWTRFNLYVVTREPAASAHFSSSSSVKYRQVRRPRGAQIAADDW